MNRWLPLLLAAAKFASGFVLRAPVYELHRDEYLYLDHGRHLAWGYLEVPPLLAGQAWVSQQLGGGFFWVAGWPALWGAATVYLVGRLVQRLGGGPWAVGLAALAYCASAYARLNWLFQPNSFEVLAFTAASYCVVRHLQTQRPAYLYGLGAALGLGLLNKYSTLLFGAALLAGLLLAPEGRRLLAGRHLWLAAGLALLLWLPNLGWQLSHGLPFRQHMQELHDTQLVHVGAADFWRAQLVMLLAALWVWGAGLGALLLHRPWRPYRVVGYTFLAGLALLTALHGKDYYSLGYYPPLLAFGAVWWQGRLAGAGRGLARGALRTGLLAWPLLLLLPLLPFLYPLAGPARMQAWGRPGSAYAALGLYRWEDGRPHPLPQDYADMLGWRELAQKTYAAYQALPDSVRANTLVLCGNYGQAGAINYYCRARRPALPAANSFNGSYQLWFPAPRRWAAVLLVLDQPVPGLAAHCRSLRQVAAITNPYARERGTAVLVALGPDAQLRQRIAQELASARAAWGGEMVN